MEFEQQPNYDPAHKTSSVTSTGTMDTIPSLCSGGADSINSYEFDELESFQDKFQYSSSTAVNDILNSFLIQQEKVVEPNFLILKQEKELLSIDQKRANHILSEQKRRNTIRGGFKELTEIIPTLKNVNNSKSTILFKSVDYIKQLDKRNKVLKDKLLSLQQKLKQKQQKQKINKLKHIELLQEQLKMQQELLLKHNIKFDSILIPCDTPQTSPKLSPHNVYIPHSHQHHNINALVIPSDDFHLSTPSLNIPADENYQQNYSNLLSAGKLNHLM